MRTIIWSVLVILLFSASAGAVDTKLTEAQVRRMMDWESVDIFQQEQIKMVGGGVALLILASSEDLCHADQNQLLLYRHGTRKITPLATGVSGFSVLDLDSNGVSEIRVEYSFTSWGETSGSVSLVQIENSQMRELYASEEFSDNLGNCGEDFGPCRSTEVTLEYRDLNADGIRDIVETVKVVADDEDPTTTVRQFLFLGDRVEPLTAAKRGGEDTSGAVQLIVVTDPRCGEKCKLVDILKELRKQFPKLNVTLYNWGIDPEAKAVMDEVGAQTLPLILFGDNFEPASAGGRYMAKWLDDKGKYQQLRIISEFDPTAEICDNNKDDTGNGLIDCADPTCRETLGCRPKKPRRLDVFVMSECPHARRGLDAMKTVLETMGKDVEFGIHFIADKTADGFSSMHGQREVEENIRRLCVMKHYAKSRKYLSYIWCRDQLGNDTDWRECTRRNGIDPGIVATCANGEEGVSLLAEDIKIAQALGVSGSPTWMLNNHILFNAITADAILEKFCSENANVAGCRKMRVKANARPGAAPGKKPGAAPGRKPVQRASDPGFR
ncbi:MAG: DsbA family protein [Proteobacteria bacterium]|nr:DsbA family protein [Pseudomonadota bacterium]